MEQADRRMHKYFAIDQVGKDTWFQPIEELVGCPKFVCDRGSRWHQSQKWFADRKQTGIGVDYFSLGFRESAKGEFWPTGVAEAVARKEDLHAKN